MKRLAAWCLCVCAGTVVCPGQQPNSADARLVIDGVDGPSYPRRDIAVTIGSTIPAQVAGLPSCPVVLVHSPVLFPGARLLPFGILDLEYRTIEPLVMGQFSTGTNGILEFQIVVPANLPRGVGMAYQGGIVSPAFAAGLTFTGAASILAKDPGPTPAPPGGMSITPTNWSAGAVYANYPIQIGRAFAQGEIQNFPGATVNGQPVLTQADVKNRWPDGSVRFAILAFIVPYVVAGESVPVTFSNQTVSNTRPMSRGHFLEETYDFDAMIRLYQGETPVDASARVMIANDKYETWTSGPVATTLIVADHSEAREYDLGFDQHRSVRPIFHVTFWPSIRRIKVRYIGEIANTEALQDQYYGLVLAEQHSDLHMVYVKPGFTHRANTRWTKSRWQGEQMPPVSIDHGFENLIDTHYLPNYNTAPLTSADISTTLNNWQNASKDIGDTGTLRFAQGIAGGHPQIGPFPQWEIQYLRSGGSAALADVVYGNADLACGWPLHFREGRTDKFFDRSQTVPAIGKILSSRARPTFIVSNFTYSYTWAQDRITPVGERTDGGWLMSRSHYPNFFFLPYVLTGDYYYLEEMYFMASWANMRSNGAATNNISGRGPTGREGVLYAEPRGMAWAGNQRLHAAFAAPDGTHERDHLWQISEEAIAGWEGERHERISASPLATDPNLGPVYAWSQIYRYSYDQTGGPGPFNYVEDGQTGYARTNNFIDESSCWLAAAPWQQHFFMYMLGRGLDFGFPTERLCAFLSQDYAIHLLHPGFSPSRLVTYARPIVKLDETYYATPTEMMTGWLPTLPMLASGLYSGWTYVGYTNVAVCMVQDALARSVLPNQAPVLPLLQEAVDPSLLDGFDLYAHWYTLLIGDSRYVGSTPFDEQWDVLPR